MEVGTVKIKEASMKWLAEPLEANVSRNIVRKRAMDLQTHQCRDYHDGSDDCRRWHHCSLKLPFQGTHAIDTYNLVRKLLRTAVRLLAICWSVILRQRLSEASGLQIGDDASRREPTRRARGGAAPSVSTKTTTCSGDKG